VEPADADAVHEVAAAHGVVARQASGRAREEADFGEGRPTRVRARRNADPRAGKRVQRSPRGATSITPRRAARVEERDQGFDRMPL
jgi:hypothetical protein